MAGIHKLQIRLARLSASLSTVQENTRIATGFLPHAGIKEEWTRWPDHPQSAVLFPTHHTI